MSNSGNNRYFPSGHLGHDLHAYGASHFPGRTHRSESMTDFVPHSAPVQASPSQRREYTSAEQALLTTVKKAASEKLNGPPYSCSHCGRVLVYRKDYIAHQERHNNGEFFAVHSTAPSYSASLVLDNKAQEHYMRALIDFLLQDFIIGAVESVVISRLCHKLPNLVDVCTVKAAPSRLRTPESQIATRRAQCFLKEFADPLILRLENTLQGRSSLHFTDLVVDPSVARNIHGWVEVTSHEKMRTISPQSAEDGGATKADLLQVVHTLSLVPAYKWLRARIRREIHLNMETANVMHDISDISLQIGTQRAPELSTQMQADASNDIHFFQFLVDWDPLSYLEQEYDTTNLANVLERAITLSGTPTDAQALTTRQYLSQVWGHTGEEVLEFLQLAILNRDNLEYRALWDGTAMIVALKERGVQVHVIGTADAISEVVEIFAWLGSSLRASPRVQGVAESIPIVTKPFKHSALYNITFTIKHDEAKPEDRAHRPDGQCWHDAFLNPVVARGYPIPRRSSQDTGLEIPLNVMAALIRSYRIVNFASHYCIKSFSAILILIKQLKDVLVWHLVYDKDGEHLSYTAPEVCAVAALNADTLSLPILETSRHVIGWCDKVQKNTGGPFANYTLDWSGLPKPHTKCAFDKVSISGGKIISAGFSAVLGKKDKPVYIKSRDDYTAQLKWIEKKFIVLYDLEDRRAWLVDGVSALLHLVRASLEQDSQDSFQELFCYRPDLLQEGFLLKNGKAAAISVLTNSYNQNLELYQKPDSNSTETTIKQTGEIEETAKRTTTYFRFKDRVDQIYHLLEQIIAYQSQIDSEDGVGFRIKYTPRRQLEGFDFMDVASEEDPFWPRVTTLKTTGAGWVDFARALHAITLFGIGFGELFKPVDTDASCPNWSEVPKGLDYLAVCASDLKDILKKRGNMRENPWRLIDDIHWHTPHKFFQVCDCSRALRFGQTCDHVQVLLPSRFPKVWSRGLTGPSKLDDAGAVIFGHSWKFPLRWTDHGDSPTIGEPTADDDLTDSFQDSGLGESVAGSEESGSLSSAGNGNGKQKRSLFDSFLSSKGRKRDKSPANQSAHGG